MIFFKFNANIITSKTFSSLLFAFSPILTSFMLLLTILLWSKAWISFKGLKHSQSHWFDSPQSLHCPKWPCYPPCLHFHPQWLPWNLELDESTPISLLVSISILATPHVLLLAWVYKISFQIPFHLMNHGVALATTTCLQVYQNLEAHCELWLHQQSFQGSWITCPTQCAPMCGMGPPLSNAHKLHDYLFHIFWWNYELGLLTSFQRLLVVVEIKSFCNVMGFIHNPQDLPTLH